MYLATPSALFTHNFSICLKNIVNWNQLFTKIIILWRTPTPKTRIMVFTMFEYAPYPRPLKNTAKSS